MSVVDLKCPPEELFTRPKCKGWYGSFDDKGFPTTHDDGKPLSKIYIGALRKALAEYRVLWEKAHKE